MIRSRWLLVSLLAMPAARADVLVVNAHGGGNFTTLSAAVAAAADGDTLLVEPAAYVESAPVVIKAKALTIVGEADTGLGLASLAPGLEVRDLPAGKRVVVQNLVLIGAQSTATSPATAALLLRDDSSHVRVQHCTLYGGKGNPDFTSGGPGLDMGNSYSAALIGCYVTGGHGNSVGITGEGGPGIIAAGGQLLVSECGVQGGRGGDTGVGGYDQGGDGGPGILKGMGSLLVVACVPSGGDGGISFHGGDGGAGLMILGSGFAWLLGGSNASGGNGGYSDVQPNGADGPDFATPPGAVTNFGGTEHAFDIASPLREGQAGLMQLGGHGDELALVFVSLVPHQLPFSGYEGVLMLSPTDLLGPFIVGPPGNQPVYFVAPALPPGVDALTFYVQPAYSGSDGVNLGTGRVLTLLDNSF